MKRSFPVLLPAVLAAFAPTVAPAQEPAPLTITARSGPSEAPLLDPNLARRIQGRVSRSALLSALAGQPGTREQVETLAKKARLQPAELATKPLDGKVAAPAQGSKVEDLDWNSGIKFSVLKNNPKVFDPAKNAMEPLGVLEVNKVRLSSYKDEAAQHIGLDIFRIAQTGTADLTVHLPPGPASYMILVHGLCCKLTYGATVSVFDKTGEKKLQMVELSSGEGSVGLVTVSPYPVASGFTGCTVRVRANESLFFGGITITRL